MVDEMDEEILTDHGSKMEIRVGSSEQIVQTCFHESKDSNSPSTWEWSGIEVAGICGDPCCSDVAIRTCMQEGLR